MTVEHGKTLSDTQDFLAGVWKSDGPDVVMTHLNNFNPEIIKALLMVNIGARASEV